METEKLIEKPIKPELIEFGLDEQKVKALEAFKTQCNKKGVRFLRVTFAVLFIVFLLLISFDGLKFGRTILALVSSAFLSWVIVPLFFKLITKRELKDFIFDKTKDSIVADIDEKFDSYSAVLKDYKKKNYLFERALRRTAWQYWLSLSPRDFEEAVGDLFLDQGYEVWMTKGSGDQGVDLYLEKGGRRAVVQCKTYKKVLGPNAARDLYGTMVSEGADEAFLAAPSGFSEATKEFCKGKPIKLLDIDDLTKMTYDFESYTPYWLDSSKSMDDVIKGVNKHILKGKRKISRY